jgi:hypothetical protein
MNTVMKAYELTSKSLVIVKVRTGVIIALAVLINNGRVLL